MYFEYVHKYGHVINECGNDYEHINIENIAERNNNNNNG